MRSTAPGPDHTTREHAVCSASGAERWLNCPGSVGLSQGLPDEPSSPAAREGTRAHELAERILRDWLGKGRTLDNQFVEALREGYRDTEFPTGDGRLWSMVDYAMTYVNVCLDEVAAFEQGPPPAVQIERRLVLDQDLGMFGTVDFFATGARDGIPTGVVVDFKYGKKKVKTESNPQLGYYGAALKRNSKRALERVKVVVVQPRIAAFFCDRWYTRRELDDWDALLKGGAERAIRQAAGLEPREFKTGGWCFWCPAREVCPAKAKAGADVFDVIEA